MDVKFKATRIEWDVDKEDVEEDFSLPKEIDVPEEIVEEAMEKMVLEMSDYISDKTGFCHKGFALECYSMTKNKLFEENERLKSQLKEQEAIRKLAEGCIYDIEITMAYICTKEKKCKECEHFLYDEENDRMACFAEIDEEARTKLDAEITEFRKSYEDKTKKEIYNDWYVINFYENYYELLVNNICDIKTDVVRWLNSFRRPLAFLYDEWLSCDDCFSERWDDMVDWIENLYRYQKEGDDRNE